LAPPDPDPMVQRVPESKVSRAQFSVESVDFKASKRAKTNQAWRYPGGKIERHPDKWINGTEYTDPKSPGENRRLNESNFFITLNTNKKPVGDEATNADAAMRRVDRQLRDPANLVKCLKFGPKVTGNPPRREDFRYDKYKDVIKSVEYQSGAEYGGNLGRFHIHIILTIQHYSQVQIHIQGMQLLFKQLWNEAIMASIRENPPTKGSDGSHLIIKEKPYIHVGRLPQTNWTDVMRNYIHKGMMQAGPWVETAGMNAEQAAEYMKSKGMSV